MPASPPPILVLCGHRVGSSAVAALLGACGMHLGEQVPASPDNPRGYAENAAVLAANNRILGRRSRDWTCPPTDLVPTSDDDADVSAALAALRPETGPWGFKDPRTLFTLPAWLAQLDAVVLVGVRRDVDATANSIRARDGIPAAMAHAIAAAYDDRLLALQQRLRFPIVDFTADMRAVAAAVEAVVAGLPGLTWRPEVVDELDGSLLNHGGGAVGSGASGLPTAPVAAPIVMRAWRDVVRAPVDLPRYHGTAFRRAREDVWSLAGATRRESGLVLELLPGPATHPLLGNAETSRQLTMSELLAGDGAPPTASHVVGSDALDYVAPDDLIGFLRRLADLTDDDGVAAVGALLVDGPEVPPSLAFPGLALVGRRHEPPYLHHRTEVEHALLSTPWRLVRVLADRTGRTRLALAKSAQRRGPDPVAGFEVRARLDELSNQRRELEASVESARDRAAAAEQRAAAAVARVAELERALAAAEAEAAAREELEDELADRQAELATREAELKERDAELAARDAELAAARQASARAEEHAEAAAALFEQLRSRRSVRTALRAARLARPLFRLVRGERASPAAPEEAAAPAEPATRRRASARQVVAGLRALRSDRGPTGGPLVSMVVPTRDGAHHLRRLFAGLDQRTAYRDFEVVVVDNGSSDDTGDVLAGGWNFPVRHVRNDHNTSFSQACNRGVAAAGGDLVLLLNNDVDPVNEGWLGEMLAALDADPALGAVGALLAYPAPEPGVQRPGPPLTVQHFGIRFTWEDGVPRARNQLHGADPTDPDLARTIAVPAATAACLLVRRAAYEEVGGMPAEYVYGTEDVDFCLRLQEAGWGVAVAGRAALFHHESSSQNALADELRRVNRLGNAQVFAETWANRLNRSMLLELFGPDRFWLERERQRVAITLTRDDPTAGWGDWYTAHELGDALVELGWEVEYAERYGDHWYELSDDVGVVISLLDACDVTRLPEHVYKIAWIRNWVDRWVEHPWFPDYDLVLVSSDTAVDIVRDRSSHVPTKVPLGTNPERFHPQPPHPSFGCDYAFTGNFWGVTRDLVNNLDIRPGERFLLFGDGWEDYPRLQRYWRGSVPYDQLPHVYSSAKVVLDDTAGPTKPYGAVNSRVFDALASGALVITDNEVGAQELFDGALPTYSSRQELRDQLDRYLHDDALREATAAKLRQMVLERYTYERVAAGIVAAARERVAAPQVAVKIGPPTHDEAEQWGDTHFARQFTAALRRLGFGTDIHILPEWDDRTRQACDVVVHLRGLVPYVPKPAHVNVLWIISHPEDVTAGECEQFDLVLVASEIHAARLRREVNVPVHTMYQATDVRVFTPGEPDPDLATRLLFVGNSRRQQRHGVTWAAERGLPLTIYGADWDGIVDPRLVRATYFPNDRLALLYRSAAVVLNDHWPDMRAAGIVSNRIFDVLASGGFVVSDPVPGLDDLFDGAVPTYETPEELEALVKHYLAAPAEAAELAARGMEITRREHSFDARAAAFRDLVAPLLERRPATVRG